MPKPGLPPTPASSTDIKGQVGSSLSGQYGGFELPPSAIVGRSSPTSSAERDRASFASADKTADVTSPRKRSHAQANTDSGLPPPPGRSRKIIQVKPKEQHAKRQSIDDADYEPEQKSSSAAAGKKKNASTSAGRKIARKTAHSLIERRRRSKMNEEFGVLKDLIPACHGQEMHKLAILQASIEYLRYLESCIVELKADGRHANTTQVPLLEASPDDGGSETHSSHDEENRDEDEEMADSVGSDLPSASPSEVRRDTPVHSSSQLPPANTLPSFSDHRDRRHYSQASSEAASPFLHARYSSSHDWSHARPGSQSSYPTSPTIYSNQTSPMLLPQPQTSELDREASAALLMLNATDRRSSLSQPVKALAEARAGSMKGISVKDLLSA